MTDTLEHSEVSTPRRIAVVATWIALLALWTARYFISFGGA